MITEAKLTEATVEGCALMSEQKGASLAKHSGPPGMLRHFRSKAQKVVVLIQLI